ncbi:MAG TPA: RNA-binding protein [Nitrospiraceae bacterium]|nr:RNA-binding protein [Nitrospiraceae bacterium]
MSTRINVSGLSYFCTDDKLREAFIPFGTVVLAQVVRDEWGHSLGLGIVQMACAEDVERVFNQHQFFKVYGSRVDLWEPAEPEGPQAERMVAHSLRKMRAVQAGQDTGDKMSQKTAHPLASLMRRFIQPLVSFSRTTKH